MRRWIVIRGCGGSAALVLGHAEGLNVVTWLEDDPRSQPPGWLLSG